MKYYIVIGSAGAYSDHSEWPVAVYEDPASAANHCTIAAKVAEMLQFLGWNYNTVYNATKGDYGNGEDFKNRLNPFDCNWQQETTYSVTEVESGSLPEIPAPPSRADKTGQCSLCFYVEAYLEDGKMPTHLVFNKETQELGFRRSRKDEESLYCKGCGQPPRPQHQDDFEGWQTANRLRRGLY